jgi:phosphatidylglycerol:prolipoprotein diacylglycerol transferase
VQGLVESRSTWLSIPFPSESIEFPLIAEQERERLISLGDGVDDEILEPMHPLCFRLGPLAIHSYGVMMALGFLAGLASWTWLSRGRERGFAFCSDLLFWIMVSGVLGARIAYVVSEWPSFAAHPIDIIRIDQGGLIYYGGFIGAAIAVFVFARVRRQNARELLDFTITSVPLAHALGRVGCLLNGCCHGKEGGGMLAVTFPPDSLAWLDQLEAGRIARDAPRSLPVHPVQLYEAAFDLALYALLIVFYRRTPRPGSTTALYLLIYPLGRFSLEFLRGDSRMRCGGLSVAQWFSVALFVVGIGFLATLRSRGSRKTVGG